MFRELGDSYGAAGAWDSLGYAQHHLGRHAQAVASYGEALTGYRRLGDRLFEADVLTHLGDAHLASGDVPAARAAWTAALSIVDDLRHADVARVRAKLAALPS